MRWVAGGAWAIVCMLLATFSSSAANRVHTVGQILRDGKAVDSADGVTVTPAAGPAQHVVRRGETIADGTRVDVPAHVVVVIVSTGGASTARLEPGASLTFVSTGRGEVVRSNAGQMLFDVVHNALDFYRVQYGDQISAGVSGTAFSVVASGKTVTFTCTRDQISITKTGYLVVGAEHTKVSLIDVISAANKRQVTYQPSATWYFASFANFAEAQASYRAQVAAAQRGGDAATLAAALTNLGFVDAALGQHPEALQAQQQALAFYRRARDRDGEARALDNLGVVQRNLGRFDDAYTTELQALALLRAIGDRDGEARALGNLGVVERNLERFADALATQQQALTLFRQLGDRDGEGGALVNAGIVLGDLRRDTDALASYERGLTLFQAVDDRDGEARALTNIGHAQEAAGRKSEALDAYRQALALFNQLGAAEGAAAVRAAIANVATGGLSAVKIIPVGANPQAAVMTPDGREVYVTDMDADAVTVIDTRSRTVTATVSVGKNPKAIVVSPDGRHVYVANNGGNVSVIDTGTKQVATISTDAAAVTGRNNVRDLAITPDGRTLYLAMEWSGLQAVDLATGNVARVSNVVCPEGLAMKPDGKRLYVSYQCNGPGEGSPGHDTVAIIDLQPNMPCSLGGTIPKACMIAGFPNVGGQIVLSPDGSQLWINGNDACSQPAYDHAGCPTAPSSVDNVIDTATNKLQKTIAFPVGDGNGPISFSPDGKSVIIGGGVLLKVLDRPSASVRQSLAISAGGDMAFSRDGASAFLPVSDKNVVVVLARGNAADAAQSSKITTDLASLSLATILHLLDVLQVPPERVSSLIRQREVDFALTPQNQALLLSADKSAAVLRAITAAKRTP